MGPDINLLAVGHPKMASDKDRLTDGIFAIVAKALFNAELINEFNIHEYRFMGEMRALSGLAVLHTRL